MAIAEDIEVRREPHTLTAGVLEAIDDGVITGVGRGPMRAKAGVGGAIVGRGSRKRGGQMAAGVGVVSWEPESSAMALSWLFDGVGVVGEGRAKQGVGGATA